MKQQATVEPVALTEEPMERQRTRPDRVLNFHGTSNSIWGVGTGPLFVIYLTIHTRH